MSGYAERTGLPVLHWQTLAISAVMPSDMVGRAPSFGGYTPDTGDRQYLRGVVIGLDRSIVFGVCR